MIILPTCDFTEPLYYNSDKYRITYLMNYKCGSTSIRDALMVRKKSREPMYEVFTVLRHPIERAASIYAETVRMNKHRGLRFTAWLQELKEGFYDYHQIPQSYWINKAPNVRLFTDVKTALNHYGISRVPELNKRQIDVDVTIGDVRLIDELYKDDIELWNKYK